VAEEIGTMNGAYLNGKKLANGVLTPIADGDELTLCRLVHELQDLVRARTDLHSRDRRWIPPRSRRAALLLV
jgi:hypothetical protein